MRPFISHCPRFTRSLLRSSLSTSAVSSSHVAALDQWIAQNPRLDFHDTFRTEHLHDLYATLPTRDGTYSSGTLSAPVHGEPLGYGHHLAFFHPRNPERALRSDGTDATFCPPEPFSRRMWASGSMEWHAPLPVGAAAVAKCSIGKVEKKGWEKGSPMVFVRQRMNIVTGQEDGGDLSPALVEERTHVFMPPSVAGQIKRVVKAVDVPKPTFSLEWTPSPTTLFRFSALTFNGHYIHLDREFAQQVEGYAERLVHGPLTALMLLETFAHYHPGAKIRSFKYRATNPLAVNLGLKFQGTVDGSVTRVWAEAEYGSVGMVGDIQIDS